MAEDLFSCVEDARAFLIDIRIIMHSITIVPTKLMRIDRVFARSGKRV